MRTDTKWFFVQALLITILFFTCILSVGIILENIRLNALENLFSNSDTRMLDAKTLGDSFSILGISCEEAIENNEEFSSRIYEEFEILSKYEEANKIDPSIKLAHKKYDVLRAAFWVNSLKIKKECEGMGDLVIYLYKYNDLSKEIKIRQDNLAYLLNRVQKNEDYNMILIPLAANNGLVSVQYLMSQYNVSQEELPVVLVNEDVKIVDMQNAEELIAHLTKRNVLKLN
jgi:hypothetical protein